MLQVCPHCKARLNVPGEKSGKQISCPACKRSFVAPLNPIDPEFGQMGIDETPDIQTSVGLPKRTAGKMGVWGSVDRRSWWSIGFYVLGFIGTTASFLGIAWAFHHYPEQVSAKHAIGLTVAALFVNAPYFLAAFLIDVLTDIRWFLQQMYRDS